MSEQNNRVEQESAFAYLSSKDAADLGLPPPSDHVDHSAERNKRRFNWFSFLSGLLALLALLTVLTFVILPRYLPNPPDFLLAPATTPQPTVTGEGEPFEVQETPVTEDTTANENTPILNDVEVRIDTEHDNCEEGQYAVVTELEFADASMKSVPTCFDISDSDNQQGNSANDPSQTYLPHKMSVSINSEHLQANEQAQLTIHLFEDEAESTQFRGEADVILFTNSERLDISNAIPLGTNHYLLPSIGGERIISLTASSNIFVFETVEFELSTVGLNGEIVQGRNHIFLQSPTLGNACETMGDSAGTYNSTLTSNSLYQLEIGFTVDCDINDSVAGEGGDYHLFKHNLWVARRQITDANMLNLQADETILVGLCGPMVTQCTVNSSQGIVSAETRAITIQSIADWNAITAEPTGRSFEDLIEVQFSGRIFSGKVQPAPVIESGG